jgi:hypothetical protein
MSSYIQNYGFTKTLIKDNNKIVKWNGEYDGKFANINIAINNNNKQKIINIQLTNDEIMDLLKIQPVSMPLETRLSMQFLNKPIIRTLMKNKSIKKKHHKKKKTRKTYYILK